jgi:hypothetical protein
MRSMVEGARNESKIIHCVAVVGRAGKRLSVIAEIQPLPPLFRGPPPPQAGEDERNGRMECAGTQGRTRA